MKQTKSLFLMMLLLSASVSVIAQKKVDPTGTWSFKAAEAPYEYSTGDMVISKDGKDYTAKLVFGGSYEIKGHNVVLEKDQLSFKVYIENETVNMKATVTKESINGTASYSEGSLSFISKRKKEE